MYHQYTQSHQKGYRTPFKITRNTKKVSKDEFKNPSPIERNKLCSNYPNQLHQHSLNDKKVFVGGIPFWANKRQLIEKFAIFGAIDRVFFPATNYRSQTSDDDLKICFIVFKDKYSQRKAISLGELNMGGRLLTIRLPFSDKTLNENQGRSQQFKIFILGFPPYLSESDLKNYFR